MSVELAKKLRHNSTAPERRLWRLMHSFRTNGYHFRKQVQIGHYYVDFACLHAGLVIELDGETHGGEIARSNDAVRDDYLRGRGFHVLRLTNDDVLHNPEGVFTVIADILATRPANQRSAPPSPTLPARGRVPAGGLDTNPATNSISTSPLAGEVGRGEAPNSYRCDALLPDHVEIAPSPPADTLPLAGRVGEGGATRSSADEGEP